MAPTVIPLTQQLRVRPGQPFSDSEIWAEFLPKLGGSLELAVRSRFTKRRCLFGKEAKVAANEKRARQPPIAQQTPWHQKHVLFGALLIYHVGAKTSVPNFRPTLSPGALYCSSSPAQRLAMAENLCS